MLEQKRVAEDSWGLMQENRSPPGAQRRMLATGRAASRCAASWARPAELAGPAAARPGRLSVLHLHMQPNTTYLRY